MKRIARFRSVAAVLPCAVVLAFHPAPSDAAELPNASFEEGERAPAGWTLSGGRGAWVDGGAADGRRAVSVTGDGGDTNYGRTGPLALRPSAVDRLSVRARNVDGAGGTPVTGPVFCNRDLGKIPREWTRYTSVFVTPSEVDPATAWLRFGQWHVKGTVAFDDVRLVEAQAVCETRDGLMLGQGERVTGDRYRFRAPFQSDSRNHAAPLARHRCGFNTNRWTFGADSVVVYRHRVGDNIQTAATVEVGVTYHRGGALSVSASADGERWTELGSVGQVETKRFAVPDALLPAEGIWVRLSARAKRRAGTDSDPGSFQVGSYEYQATLDREAGSFRGRTRFLAVTAADPKASVQIEGIGDGVPGGDNVVTARVTNPTGRTLRVRGSVQVRRRPGPAGVGVFRGPVLPGEHVLRIRYAVPRAGRLDMTVRLEGDVRFEAETTLNVAHLFSAAYGERLPGSTGLVGLWWASSGWKVSRTRPVPDQDGEALTVRAARNEAEAAQLVVRPRDGLRGLAVSCRPLVGPGGATIPARNVEVLRVRYVDLELPTDATGVAAPWPDPLPPFREPVDVPAGTNQPLWVRVNVPSDAASGVYDGAIRLTADGYRARVPLRVEVYDFTLPDRMTCTTAFGFSPGNVWRYQKVKASRERREVLLKYWANLSAHHISPYDPAPLDPLKVTWPGSSDWQGGRRDGDVRRSGRSSLRIDDTSTTSQASARYGSLIKVPREGLRLTLWHRTHRPGHEFIVTFNHHDADGQWMSGRNRDMGVTGSTDWQRFERTVTSFPAGARSVGLTLWAAVWKDDGSPTGTVWYDDLSLADAATGEELVEGGGFEPVPPVRLRPRFDWSAWDGAMTRAIDRYHFNSFRLRVPGLGGGSFHERWEPSLLGYGEDTPEYRAAFGSYCRALQEHLRERGWLDEAFVYWFDEPAPKDYAFVTNGFRKLKEAMPDVDRMLTEQVEPGLLGGPNVWCPVTPNYDHDAAETRRREGERFWWYVCTGPKAPYCTLFIDHPATEMRVWLWQTWKRKIEGILVWQTNYWTSGAAYPDPARPQDPYADPMGWTSGYSTPKGTRRPWGNGDGRFIYPPEAAADGRQRETVLEGPVDSIRWEMLRDGIEDYEYLAVLRGLLERKREAVTPVEYRRLAALLEVPESITRSMTDFTKDPAPLEARRDEIARAIETLAGIR